MANTQIATGGQGPLNQYINWCNFTGIAVSIGTTLTLANTIPNVGKVFIDLYSNSTNTNTWLGFTPGGAPFNIAYTGVSNSPGIYTGASVQTLNFNNIRLTDFSNNPLNRNYSVFVCDGEITGSTAEYVRWTTDGSPWILLATIPSNVNALSTVTGEGSNTIQNTSKGGSGAAYITPVAASQDATRVVFTINGQAFEATTFGILFDSIEARKQVSSGYAGVGTVLTYTIPISNISATTLNSISLVDTLPSNLSYISGSYAVNNVTQPDPVFPNLTVNDISSGAVATVVFKVKVESTLPNPIINSAYISGTQGIFDSATITNSTATTINFAWLNASKVVDKTICEPGEELTYSIYLNNNGNVTANSIVLIDTIPSGTTYVSGSLTGGTGTPIAISVPNITPNASATITFRVLTSTNPNNPLLNNSTATYSYIFNPLTAATLPGGAISNEVSTTASSASITSVTKTASESYGGVLDTIKYTLVFINSGNDTATNVILSDTIPNGTTFIEDTVTINSVTIPGLNITPPGVNIGSVAPSIVTTVTFNILVNTIPSPNPITNQGILSYSFTQITIPKAVLSNLAVTTINYSFLSVAKEVSKEFTNLGSILTYTIPISNTGNVTATNVVFLDTLPNGVSLISGSVKQDNTLISTQLNTGVTLPNPIGPNSSSLVTFQVQVVTVPSPNPIVNNAYVTSSYIIDTTTSPNRIGNSSANTNSTTTKVNFASLVKTLKYVDKTYATCRDTITYTIVLPNTGNVTAINVVVVDTIPNGTVLVADSVSVNGATQTGANPSSGVTIPNIAPGATSTITFSVQVQC